MINRILICSDFLMTSDSEQKSNLPWVYDILNRPIKNATSINVETFSSSTDDDSFNRAVFFQKSDIKLSVHNTQFDFSALHITEDSKEYLKSFINENCLLIGYEFSSETQKILSDLGCIYVDIWLHPVRFLDDILFAFSSNNSEVYDAIDKYNISEDTMYLYADRFKISTYKGFKRYNNLNLIDNAALFIGQTLEDKAVLKNNTMLNITHFKHELDSLAQKYNVIYYSKHPYVKNDTNIMSYINNHPSIHLIDTPAYILLAQNEIKKVVSISSSVALEAKYFDKDVQILHKPVINFTPDYNTQDYYTVMQDFISPHFWTDILSSIISTNECQEVNFLDRKDKLRDMLGFYWSYKIIDKTEQMRNQLTAVERKVQQVDKKIQPLLNKAIQKTKNKSNRKVAKIHYAQPDQKWGEITSIIDKSKIVSFDIFDTLLVRPLEHASDLFILMEEKVQELTNGKIIDFKTIRIKARSLVQNSQCGEEISLQERYNAISKQYNIDKKITDQIMELELDLEKHILQRREYTNKILAYANEQNKKIIIVSDTFFTKSFVEELLHKNSITQYDELFVSSEIGLLKHTGSIFPYLLEKFNIVAEEIVHIGDNAHADITKAKEHNLQTIHIPRTIDEFNNKTGLSKTYRSNDYLSSSIIKGIIGNKIMDNPFNFSTPSHTNGNKEQFGFSILGPMFYGFAQWILEEVKKLDINTVYFLSRDGDIVKQCYDIIAQDDTSAPASKYLYASRRAYSIPSIFTYEDIVDIAIQNFSPISLSKILKNRFGINIELFDQQSITSSGFQHKDEIISSSTDLDRLLAFLEKNQDMILNHAQEERIIIQEYLKGEGLNSNDKIIIVDIGHNGTLQKRLSKILFNDNITGLYFVTQDGITDNTASENMVAKGYVGDKINGKDTRHPYNRHLLMFEAIFLNTETSLVSFYKDINGEIHKNFLPSTQEEIRIEFIKNIQKGILWFNEELVRHKALFPSVNFKIDGRSSINPYLALLQHPYQLDVEMFNKVTFENNYSGRDHNYLFFYDKSNYELSKKHSIWDEALEACEFNEPKNVYLKHKIFRSVVFGLNKINILSDKKLRKFNKNPEQFFEDTKNPIIKIIARLY